MWRGQSAWHGKLQASKTGNSIRTFLPVSGAGGTSQEVPAQRFAFFSECLTWNQVRELRSAGIAFGSHTVSHPQLTTVKPHELEMEVRESKRVIEDKLGCRVQSFAYPYAFPETDRTFKQRLRAILLEAGYLNGVSTIIGRAGRNGDAFFMKRLPVNSCDDARLFYAKLEGAYDWLHMAQHLSKVVGSFRYQAKVPIAEVQGHRQLD